jgi:hypothetical protein
MDLLLFGELAAVGHEFAAYYDPAKVERLIAAGRAALDARLSAS